jgi:hypothetical protein
MKIIVLLVSLTISLLAVEPAKIVVDLTAGDIERIEYRLFKGVPNMINHFKENGTDVDSVVVVHGGAYKFFVDNLDRSPYWTDETLVDRQEEMHEGLMKLVELGVKFEICEAGLRRNGVLSEDLYSFVKTIPSSMIGLATWQNKGFAYIPLP